jgi:hypothetical protein
MRDQFAENPLENDDGQWTLHRFDDGGSGRSDFFPPSIGLRRKFQVGLAFTVHSCGEEWFLDFSPDFDSPDGLWVWDHKPDDMGAKTTEDRRKDAKNCLDEYNRWVSGEVFGYDLRDAHTGEQIDNCWGFVGAEWLAEHLHDEIMPGLKLVKVSGDAAEWFDADDLAEDVEIADD